MALTDDLAAALPKDRPGIKARAIAALANLDGQTFTRGAFTATILDPQVDGQDLVLTLRFLRDGIDVTPPDFNPLRIVNPPVLVPDPAGTITRTFTRLDGTTGTQTFRVDVRAALLASLRSLVR